MKKIKNSLLSVCLCISLMFGCFAPSINVYASSGPVSNFVDTFTEKFYEIANKTSGIIFSPIAGVKDSFMTWLGTHKDNYGGSNQTTDDFINSNFSYDNDYYSIGGNLINSMRDFNQYYISNDANLMYGFTYGYSQWVERFENPALLNSFHNILEEYQGYLILAYSDNYNWPSTIIVYEPYVKAIYDRGYTNSISVNLASSVNSNASNSDYVTAFTYSGSQYSEITNPSNVANYYYGALKYNPEDPIVSLNVGQRLVSLDIEAIPIYDTLSDAFGNNSGLNDFYVSDSFNTNQVTSSNTYTYTRSEIDNSVTYNDISDFIDDYHNDNNEYPNSNIIYIFINNYTGEDNPDNPDDPDNPDNPDTPDDDDKNIWDFLSELGDIIGNLIAGLGEILAGILSAITSIINSFKEGFPNVIGSLLEYFLPFLPEEIITLISLSILFSIILGIVKIIRG